MCATPEITTCVGKDKKEHDSPRTHFMYFTDSHEPATLRFPVSQYSSADCVVSDIRPPKDDFLNFRGARSSSTYMTHSGWFSRGPDLHSSQTRGSWLNSEKSCCWKFSHHNPTTPRFMVCQYSTDTFLHWQRAKLYVPLPMMWRAGHHNRRLEGHFLSYTDSHESTPTRFPVSLYSCSDNVVTDIRNMSSSNSMTHREWFSRGPAWVSCQTCGHWSNSVKSCCCEWTHCPSTTPRFLVSLYSSNKFLHWEGVMLYVPPSVVCWAGQHDIHWKDKNERYCHIYHFMSCLSSFYLRQEVYMLQCLSVCRSVCRVSVGLSVGLSVGRSVCRSRTNFRTSFNFVKMS